MKKLRRGDEKEMNALKTNLLFVLIAVLLLSACGGTPATAVLQPTQPPAAVATATQEPAATAESTVPAIAATEVQPAGCLGSADKALVDLSCREITIAVENAYLPFNYIALDTGLPGGWDYETWNEICTLLHCTPVFTEAAWEGVIQAVSDNQFDVAADGITITAERQEIVDFSIGYIKIQQRLLVRPGEDRFTSLDEFVTNPELILGTQTGTTNYETAAKYLPEARIKAFEQYPFAVQALISKDLDAVILDEVVGLGYQGQNQNEVELLGPSISSDELGFIYPKGSDLVEPVNQALEALMKNGTLEKINLKYFGPDFKLTYDDIK